jgi:hypothetical protein
MHRQSICLSLDTEHRLPESDTGSNEREYQLASRNFDTSNLKMVHNASFACFGRQNTER